MSTFHKVPSGHFIVAFADVRYRSERVENATSRYETDDRATTAHYLSADRLSGYAVRTSGELVYVFSDVKGRGDAIVSSAVANGATHLDCFDGYLTTLYARHGFIDYKRESNWTPGGPDVVYMQFS